MQHFRPWFERRSAVISISTSDAVVYSWVFAYMNSPYTSSRQLSIGPAISFYSPSQQMCFELLRWRAPRVRVVACLEVCMSFDRRLLVKAEVAHRALSHSPTFDFLRSLVTSDLRGCPSGPLSAFTSCTCSSRSHAGPSPVCYFQCRSSPMGPPGLLRLISAVVRRTSH